MTRSLVCLILLAVPVNASANSLKDSLLAVNKALGQVRSAGSECKGKALPKLKDARDQLNMARGKATLEIFTKARRAAEDALDEAGDACTGTARDAMQSALDKLQAALDALATAAATPSPEEKKAKERRACWNFVNDGSRYDPGCHHTKNGNYAIGRTQFNAILSKVQKAGDRFGKTDVVERELGYDKKPYVTCLQLATIARHLLHDNDRLALIQASAERIVDPQHSHSVTRQIQNSQTRKEAQRLISEAAD